MPRGRPAIYLYCGNAGSVINKGFRMTKTMGKRRIKLCKACGRKFTPKNQKPVELTEEKVVEANHVIMGLTQPLFSSGALLAVGNPCFACDVTNANSAALISPRGFYSKGSYSIGNTSEKKCASPENVKKGSSMSGRCWPNAAQVL